MCFLIGTYILTRINQANIPTVPPSFCSKSRSYSLCNSSSTFFTNSWSTMAAMLCNNFQIYSTCMNEMLSPLTSISPFSLPPVTILCFNELIFLNSPSRSFCAVIVFLCQVCFLSHDGFQVRWNGRILFFWKKWMVVYCVYFTFFLIHWPIVVKRHSVWVPIKTSEDSATMDMRSPFISSKSLLYFLELHALKQIIILF